jgi:hypothetical protein
MKLAIVFASLIQFQQTGISTTISTVDNFIANAQVEAVDPQKTANRIPAIGGLSAWVEDIQVRQQTDSTFNPFARKSSPAYEFRVTPKAWGQREAEQESLNLRSEIQEAQYKKALNDALYRRYLVLIDLFAQQTTAQLLINSSTLLESEVQLNKSLIGSREFNIKKLLDAEVAVARTQGLTTISVGRLNSLRAQVELKPTTEVQVAAEDKLDWLVDYNQIRETMRQEIDPQRIPAIMIPRLQVARISAEEKVNKTRQRFSVNALSSEFTLGANNADYKTKFMVSVNIPLGSENFKSLDNRYALQEAEAAYQLRLGTDKHTLALLKFNALQLLQERDLLQVSIQKNASRLATNAGKTDAELGLILRLENVRQLRELADIEHKTMTAYLEYLYVAGHLIEQPLRNWIRRDRPVIASN